MRGEVAVSCSPDHAELLVSGALRRLTAKGIGSLEIEKVKLTSQAPRRLIVKFAGVDSVDAAEGLRAATLCASRDDIPELDADVFYFQDLEGLDVIAGEDTIGTVREVFATGANEVLVVARSSGPDLLVPFVQDAVTDVDLDARRVVVDGDFLGLEVE